MKTVEALHIYFDRGLWNSEDFSLHVISGCPGALLRARSPPPFCSHLVCGTLSRLSCMSLLLIYSIIPDWRGRWMQSHTNGQRIGCVVRSADGRSGSWPPPSRPCGKCNLNPEQFAGLTFRLGRSFSGRPPPLFLRVHQPGSAQPWLGLGVKIHLHSIGIHLVQLLATSSSGALHFKFHYVLSGLWEFKQRLKRRTTKWAETKVIT